MSIETLEEILKKTKELPPVNMSVGSPASFPIQNISYDDPLKVSAEFTPKLPSKPETPSVKGNGLPQPTSPVEGRRDSPSTVFPSVLPTVQRGLENAVPEALWTPPTSAPDTSGYEEIESRIKGLQGENPNAGWIDLAAMGLTTLLGASQGQIGAGAKVAGSYGIKRASEREDRQHKLEQALLALQAKRAAQLAKAKGAKPPTPTWRDKVYTDDTGVTRIMKYRDSDTGFYVPSPEDQAISSKDLGLMTLQNEDGSTEQLYRKGGSVIRGAGGQNAPMSVIEDAEGGKNFYNPRTAGRVGSAVVSAPPSINETSMGLTKKDQADWDKASQSRRTDTGLAAFEKSYNSATAAAQALARGDVGGALEAVKRITKALEDGTIASDADFRQTSTMDLGLAKRLEQYLERMQKGGVVSNEARAELMGISSSLITNSRNNYNRRNDMYYNTPISKQIPNRPDLAFEGLPEYSGAKQGAAVHSVNELGRELVSGQAWTTYARDANGNFFLDDKGRKIKAVHQIVNDPVTGKPEIILREAR